MANQEHLKLLFNRKKLFDKGETWNEWRKEHPEIQPDLSNADLPNGDFDGMDLSNANLRELEGSCASFHKANLSGADLGGANLGVVDFSEANLSHAILCGAILSGSNFQGANFTGANLQGAFFDGPHINGFETKNIDLRGVNLAEADLSDTDLSGINFSGADLRNAKLAGSNLEGSNFSGADLRGADLTGCYVYAISAWNVRLEGSKQKDLVITPEGEPEITVDNLELAQFIYLLLNNQDIRQVIDTITSHVVLILGHFNGKRKAVLDVLKHELRTQHYSPVVFDFGELADQDFRETVRTLANMARFVLVDLTDLGNVLDQMVEVVPHCRVPIQPLLLLDAHQYQYHQLLDLRRKHPWLLPLYRYQNSSSLLTSFHKKIIQPLEKKCEELKRRKPVQIFCHYAQEDAELFTRLKKHLISFEQPGQIAVWDDQKLAPGEEKAKEIEKYLNSANIILLLVSPDFLFSNNCVDIQDRAMERHEKGDAIVIPLLLRPCRWRSTALGRLQVLPRNEIPVVQSDIDSIFFEVTNELAEVIKGLW